MSKDYKWGSRSLSHLDDPRMHPGVKKFMTEVLFESTVDLTAIDGARDADDQAKMFKGKKSSLDGVKRLSDHQIEKYPDNLCRAVDVIPACGKRNVWNVDEPYVAQIWSEYFRAMYRVDRLWKDKGVDVGLELGWTYDIHGGRDYPHASFKKL